jgi:hypothetical protein
MRRPALITLFVLSLATAGLTGCAFDSSAATDDASSEAVTSENMKKSEVLLHEAVVMAEARATGEVCATEAYQTAILDKLHAAVKLRDTDYFRTKVIAKQPVLVAQMKQNLAFYELTGVVKVKAGTVTGLERGLASGVIFWGPASGAYGEFSKFEFQAAGKVVVYTLKVDDQGAASWDTANDAWSVDANDATGRTVIVAGNKYSLDTSGSDWELQQDLANPSTLYVSSPAECEA